VSATIFILISFASILIFKVFLSEEHLTEKFAALVCIVFSVLLGFVDDVIDIPWRYKLIIPLFGILPVLIAYDGVTYVLLPDVIREMIGKTVDLGILYYIYMALLGIFCTNSINIYAGINGLEVGNPILLFRAKHHHCLFHTDSQYSGDLLQRSQ
jgi:UDP-N-acetylglucosamine--dolichyl-phosphate N-acetylglucosaminephosphotransferase